MEDLKKLIPCCRCWCIFYKLVKVCHQSARPYGPHPQYERPIGVKFGYKISHLSQESRKSVYRGELY